MKNIGGLIAYAMSQYGIEPGKVKELNVTENGTYTAPSGYMGFNPINTNVDVTPIIQELSVSEPGTYYAKTYGCDGFDPIIVSDKYKKLYKQAKGEGESINTGITDKDGNEIVLDNAIETTWTGWAGITVNNDVTIVDSKASIKVRLYTITEEVKNTQTGEFLEYQKCLQVEMTNLKTGDTYSNMASRYWYTRTTASGISLINFRPEGVRIVLGELQIEGNTYSGNEKASANHAYFAFYLRCSFVSSGSLFSDDHPVFLQAVYS